MNSIRQIAILVAGCLSCSVLAWSQTNTAADFADRAAQDGMAEVELAKLALDKSNNPSVRQFARQMQQDHEKANAELEAVAKRADIPTPEELDSDHQEKIAALKLKSGPDFDAAYAQEMSAAHALAVALFSKESQAGDAELSSFAGKKLPVLQEHQQMADKLAASLRVK